MGFITETALEMHFHRPLMELFRDSFGLGGPGEINFYKYSQQRECFIGFDQAYVRTELTEEEFFATLKTSAASNYKLTDKFLGYFLQFKVVREMQSRGKYTPTIITNKNHFRVGLDTKKNMNTGVSQHELLYNLNHNNPGAMVYYACPMLFDRADLYDVNIDLDPLRLADFDACPSAYADNDNHFIFFDGAQEDPIWCSDPVRGKAVTPRDFVAAALSALSEVSPERSAQDLLKMLTDTEAVGINPEADEVRYRPTPNILSLVSESLTIVRIKGGAVAAQQHAAADVSASGASPLRQSRG